MNETTTQTIRQTLPALKALEKSINNTGEDVQAAAASIAVKTYGALHQRVAAALPDDVYVTDALALDLESATDERGKLAQVQIAVAQLIPYLKGLLADADRQQGHTQDIFGGQWLEDIEDIKDISRSLRDNILEQTRNTLRRAFADIEINIDTDFSPKKKRRVHISHDDEGKNIYRRADLTGRNFSGQNLSNADMRQANLTGAVLTGTNLSDADLRGANLTGASMDGADLSNADLRNANLTGAILDHANFFSADMGRVSLTGANLIGADLTNADLRDVDFSGAVITDAQLHGANLRGAVLPDGTPYHSSLDLGRYGVRQDTFSETDE